MDRSEEEVSGVPDSFRGDESPATKSQLWYQQEATRQSFQKLNVRLGETFDELRQANTHTRKVRFKNFAKTWEQNKMHFKQT